MKCIHCNTNMRVRDIDNTIFRIVDDRIVGNVECRNSECKKITTVMQVTTYIPIFNLARRKDD